MVDETKLPAELIEMLALGFDEALIELMLLGTMDITKFWGNVARATKWWAIYEKAPFSVATSYGSDVHFHKGIGLIDGLVDNDHTVWITDYGKDVLTWWVNKSSTTA